jgi:hypothetical protein
MDNPSTKVAVSASREQVMPRVKPRSIMHDGRETVNSMSPTAKELAFGLNELLTHVGSREKGPARLFDARRRSRVEKNGQFFFAGPGIPG